MSANWTKPYYGVQHLGRATDGYWLTVSDYGSFAELLKWFPGCKLSPMEETHDTAEAARGAGEAWLSVQRTNMGRAA